MNTPETAHIVRKIEESVQVVLSRIRVNTWLFAGSLLITGVLVVMMIYVLLWLNAASLKADESKALALESNRIAAEANAQAASNKAKYDELFKQYSDYISQNVSAWNKLQKDNFSPDEIKKRGIIVPVAPILRPSGLPAPSDKELERTTRPVQKEVVRKQKVYVREKKKQTPTPIPAWYKFFKQTR